MTIIKQDTRKKRMKIVIKMDVINTEGKSSKLNRNNSAKDLNESRGSIKSIEKSVNSNTSSLKSDKEIHFDNSSKHNSDNQKVNPEVSLKVPNKIIANWKHACDRTRDRTKDLLKRWRTLPEFEAGEHARSKNQNISEKGNDQAEHCGWSVHVWTTWVDRFSIDNSEEWEEEQEYQLTPTQSNKFSHFFTCLLDHDQDDLISEQDFEALIERLRHFADWSTNSAEFNILREVERGFMETFLHDIIDDKLGFQINNQTYMTREGWLRKWAHLVDGAKNLSDFPVWLQYFSKVLFQVINRSGSGIITRDELSAFYSSVLGLDTVRVGETIDLAYQAMTSNGDHPLGYKAYRLCFANYLLARFPNGPGQFILGTTYTPISSALFPVDYSALNAQPEDLEQFTPDQKSNRRSVIV